MGPVQFDYATIKYNFSGNIEWDSRYDGPDHDIDEATDIVVDNSGNVFVAGQSYATQQAFDFLTIQYDPSGVEQWTHRYNGTADSQDHLHVMAIDDIGNVYVTGQSVGTTSLEDIVTIKYGVTGIEEDTRFTIHDTGYNLTMSPNPFTHQTQIRFTIHDTGCLMQNLTLGIYDVSGRLVKSFGSISSIPGLAPRSGAGENQRSSISWNGRDDQNRKLGSGVYFVTLEAGDYRETCRILLVR